MAVFGYRSGRSIKGLEPQTIGEELERIRDEHGGLTPEAVVLEAEPEDSPLHDAFEWDNKRAAHQHRLAQARKLIVSIRVLDAPATSKIPVYVSVSMPSTGRSYVPTATALDEEQIRARVLDDIRKSIEALERRWRGFAEATQLIDQLKQNVG